MQALFSFYQGDQKNPKVALNALDESIQNIYNLYLYELKIFWHFHSFLKERLQIEKTKKIPNLKRQARIDSLLNMPFMQALVLDKEVLRAWDKNIINWDDDIDMIRGAFFPFGPKRLIQIGFFRKVFQMSKMVLFGSKNFTVMR